MKLILASESPRRRELLALLGMSFDSIATAIDETPGAGEAPQDYTQRLSREKAQAAAREVGGDAIIIACDTTVADGDAILGKPIDGQEAAAMLKSLRGRTHTVYTAVTVLDTATGRSITQTAVSPVKMRNYSDAEIVDYVNSGDPFDKAGAYAIQHPGFHPVEGFDHCYANVMGLPLCHVTWVLRELGIEPAGDVPSACQQHIDYACPVFENILCGGI